MKTVIFGKSTISDILKWGKLRNRGQLEFIREKIDRISMKGVFNMDETGLIYRLKADHSLDRSNLKKQTMTKKNLQSLTRIAQKSFLCLLERIQN